MTGLLMYFSTTAKCRIPEMHNLINQSLETGVLPALKLKQRHRKPDPSYSSSNPLALSSAAANIYHIVPALLTFLLYAQTESGILQSWRH